MDKNTSLLALVLVLVLLWLSPDSFGPESSSVTQRFDPHPSPNVLLDPVGPVGPVFPHFCSLLVSKIQTPGTRTTGPVYTWSETGNWR